MHRFRLAIVVVLLLLSACAWWIAGRRTEPAASLRFDHTKHSWEGLSCSHCHSTRAGPEAAVSFIPREAACLHCHERAYCSMCHVEEPDLIASTRHEPFAHRAGWLGRHGLLARSGAETCQVCHGGQACASCHTAVPAEAAFRLAMDSVDRFTMHRGDFVTSHPLEARAEGDRCLRCHNAASCSRCHEAKGVRPGGADPRQRHPAGWLDRSSDNFHGQQARLHIETCAACHDQGAASICVVCHRSGAGGGNPHPPGWNKRYDLGDVAGNPTCVVCH
jgi:hypothetical protein